MYVLILKSDDETYLVSVDTSAQQSSDEQHRNLSDLKLCLFELTQPTVKFKVSNSWVYY